MKSLQTILTESILDADGPKMMDESPMWPIYKALDALPKCKCKVYGRYCWPWSRQSYDKFALTIRKGVNLNDGIKYRRISEVLNQSGFAFLQGPGAEGLLAAWDRPSNTYILTRIEEMTAEKGAIEKLKKAGFEVNGDDAWPTFEAFTVLYEHVDNLTSHGHYLMDDYGDWSGYDGGMFFPCAVDMNLIKKTLDAKARGAIKI